MAETVQQLHIHPQPKRGHTRLRRPIGANPKGNALFLGEMHCPETETPYFFGKGIVPKRKRLIFSGKALSRNGNALFFQERHCPETETPYFFRKGIVLKRKCLIFSGKALS
jgi:hypothetical protein